MVVNQYDFPRQGVRNPCSLCKNSRFAGDAQGERITGCIMTGIVILIVVGALFGFCRARRRGPGGTHEPE